MSFKKKLSKLSLGELENNSFQLDELTLSNEHQGENPNLPHHEQLHHASGDQASDHFFSLDGFIIPENINEDMLHPKQPTPGPIPSFHKVSSDDDLSNLTHTTRKEIMDKLIKIQNQRRNRTFTSQKIPKLDTDIRIVSTNLNAPVK